VTWGARRHRLAAAVLVASIAGMSTSLPAQTTSPAAAQRKRSDLDGVWILARNARTENLKLTPAGEAARARYEPLRHDPDLKCIPASFTRVMHTPSPPTEIRQFPDHVEINYEFMDVHRRVPLEPGLAIKDAPYAVAKFPNLGRSVGHYEGETLVVENGDVEAGVHDTLGTPGLPQSDQMHTVERFVPNGDTMQVIVTHTDPVYYEQPFVVTFTFQRLFGGKILPWDCTPDAASYERFFPAK
jgi:hypothetical protein